MWGVMFVGAFLAVMVPLAIALYFVPTMVAAYRRAAIGPVFLINFFTGWTTIGWVGALVLAAVSRSEDEKRALGYGYGGFPGAGYQLGPGFSYGHPGAWPGHPAQGFPAHGHPGAWPGNPAQGFPAPGAPIPGQPYGAVPPGFGHPGAAAGFGYSPNPYESVGDDSSQGDLPYGGFGSTPYGQPGGYSDDPFGKDPFGRKPYDDEPENGGTDRS